MRASAVQQRNWDAQQQEAVSAATAPQKLPLCWLYRQAWVAQAVPGAAGHASLLLVVGGLSWPHRSNKEIDILLSQPLLAEHQSLLLPLTHLPTSC